MKQVAKGLQMGGNFGTAHVYRSSLNAIIAYRGKGDFTFNEVTPEWIKASRFTFVAGDVAGTLFPPIYALSCGL